MHLQKDIGAIALFALRDAINQEARLSQNLGTLSIAALNYSMGRCSYAPSLVIDYIKSNWYVFHNGDRRNFLRDTVEFVNSNRSKGHDCDVKTWEDFKTWLIIKMGSEITQEYYNREITLSRFAELLGLTLDEAIEFLKEEK